MHCLRNSRKCFSIVTNSTSVCTQKRAADQGLHSRSQGPKESHKRSDTYTQAEPWLSNDHQFSKRLLPSSKVHMYRQIKIPFSKGYQEHRNYRLNHYLIAVARGLPASFAVAYWVSSRLMPFLDFSLCFRISETNLRLQRCMTVCLFRITTPKSP